MARILQGSEQRDEDLATLLRAQLVFWMLAATDGHAKNFSLRLLPHGNFRMTPLYDVLSAWPIAGAKANQIHPKRLKLAMAVGGSSKHYRIADIRRSHFNETARRCGYGMNMEALVEEVVEKTDAVVETVGRGLPEGFPPLVSESIFRGLRTAGKQLSRTATTSARSRRSRAAVLLPR